MKNKYTETTGTKFIFWLMTYPAAIILGLFFRLLFITNRIKIKHLGRFPKWQKKWILCSNHPSFWEPLILPALFFSQYLFHFKKFAPISAPDKKNFGKNLFFFPLRPVCIFVPRGDKKGQADAYKIMLQRLKEGAIVILHPEGGRTSTEKNQTKYLYSPTRRCHIRPFRNGIGRLVSQTGATVLPVWVEGSDKVIPNDGSWFPHFWKNPVTIIIGYPVKFNSEWKTAPAMAGKKTADIISHYLEEKSLELADEE